MTLQIQTTVIPLGKEAMEGTTETSNGPPLKGGVKRACHLGDKEGEDSRGPERDFFWIF